MIDYASYFIQISDIHTNTNYLNPDLPLGEYGEDGGCLLLQKVYVVEYIPKMSKLISFFVDWKILIILMKHQTFLLCM